MTPATEQPLRRDHRPFVITGSGRCGTGYSAKLFAALGYDIEHESVFQPSTVGDDSWRPQWEARRCDSSWLAAPFLSQLPADTVVFHQVRNPVDVVRSLRGIRMFRDDNRLLDPFSRVAEAVTPGPPGELPGCMNFWVEWNALIPAACAGRMHCLYQVEEIDAELIREMVGVIDPARSLGEDEIAAALGAVPSNYNARDRAEAITWQSLPSGELKQRMAHMAEVFGYELRQLEAA